MEVVGANKTGILERFFFDFQEGEKAKFNWRILLGLLVFAFLLRVPLLIFPEVIHNDGTEYIRHARQIFSGDWAGGKAPPLYPSLIALVHLFIPNEELGGIWISVLFGTFLVLPIFYLGKEIFNERVAILSGLFLAVHPFLAIASGSVLSESTYYFFVATSLFFGWKAFTKGRFFDILLFSLSTALAFLTRPEGIGYLFVFSVWVLLIHPPEARRLWIKKISIILLTFFCFLLFVSPYLIQIRQETGRWGISKKFSISVELPSEEGESSIENIPKKKEINLHSVIRNPLTVFGKIGLGFLDSLYKFQQVFNPILFSLALLGLLLERKHYGSLKGNLYLIAYLVFFLGVVLPFFWITRRYTSQMIPAAIPWSACGMLAVSGWVRLRYQEGIWQKKLPAVLLTFVLIGLLIQGRVIHPRAHRFIQRETGLWMRDHLPRGAKVMSNLPQEAFYADLPWIRMPQGTYEEIMDTVRSRTVRYLITDEHVELYSPGFFEKVQAREELRKMFELKRKAQRLIVWEWVGSAGEKVNP